MTDVTFDLLGTRAAELSQARALRMRIASVVGVAWPRFVAEHPALARVVDPELLKDYAFDALADDPAFVRAYRDAVAANAAAGAIVQLIEPFVSRVIGRLL